MMETYNFDVEPLSFSDHDIDGADCFDDFDLDGSIGRALFDSNSDDASDDDLLDRMFKEDSKTNDDLETMFLDAEIDESYRRSSSMMMADYTRTDDTNTSSRIRLESLLETQYNPCRTTHRRAIIKDEQLVDDVNFFDPETIFTTPTNDDNNVEKSNKRKKKSREDYRKNRRVSCSDLDSMRFNDHTSYKQPTTPHDHVVTPKPHRRVTVDCAAPSLSQLFGHHHDYDNNRHSSHAGILQELPAASVAPHPTTPPTLGATEKTIEYHEALQKLAASMKRSELSRRQVMMHRQNDYQAHQTREHVVTTIEQQLRQQAGCVATEQHYNTSQPHTIQQDDRSCIMSAFFSGSRGTLTNGLEHSRMQLKMYSALMRRESL